MRTRRFVRDYSLPVIVTLVFLLIATGVSALRATSRSSVAGLLAGATTTSEDYARLSSSDKPKELERNNDVDESSGQAPVGSPSSFAINTGGSTTTTETPTGGNQTQPEFSVAVSGFQHDGTELVCSTPKPKPQTCSKRYTFSVNVRTQNGPGSVVYGWRSNLQTAVSDSSFAAGSGQVDTPLSKVITLACTQPSSFSLQLVVIEPSSVQSATLNTNHNCNDI